MVTSDPGIFVKQIKGALQRKLRKINEAHEKANTFGNNTHKREERRAIEETASAIEQIESLANVNLKNSSYELSQETTSSIPRLVFYKKTGRVEYFSEDQKLSSATFAKNTSEGKVLQHLAYNSDTAFMTSDLLKYLNDPRQGADFPDPKKRVNDVVKVIRKKLSPRVVKTTTNGYMIECKVILV
ncbi:hypothetical protein A3B50_00600 [Candidatus Roizmanbacteria bacterium RIFCSPLOWO2_01_FULL_40_42]|uniref:Uncharacterized protein n=1 Tax=Candidatus Roizmanbacteria bacterium RIFCSPLOWO2_01_FULL_40_42 TaxID=1802066 RepID=A0A1F7J4Z5_9BACT|nr:MAG: hypothetical protein A2779_01505 [Candidatus Roizmanbacteria bacterium RIFCSPHIGHO2_01_FULL_40_98]OGK29036.1 MAG: hypothetical protein A3C31_02145 [Candidatus Roizmanbacteria bacterium RIFCSPHIGHO2_02_FULL_40_53]OGK36291.1 MAG: hypothetical protein A3E69_03590 [Candidatus Roizmanbacteria bacterium RIFCSPHIGHO2_12_FULL_40_130]OGK50663.1 MAG: hypothetical protein A3B50_00600 [Candidatus Roizmanbacteria bacterium RIFCSPLOWO2_01_FULL_40_42]